jgi:hypothetical protein
MRDLIDCEKQDVRSAEAIILFYCHVKKWIVALTLVLIEKRKMITQTLFQELLPKISSFELI